MDGQEWLGVEECAASMRDLRGTTIDRYRVESLLGSGGMGSVWLVRHVESLQTYALKTMHATAAADRGMLERFLREARAAAALKSKHVVKIVDAQINYLDPTTKAPLPFMVMELLEGETLERMISRRGPLPYGEALWVLRQVAKGLEAAHARGIVHRDLKPENVFLALDEDGEPVTKVCDFGIAKLVGDAAAGLVDSGALGTQTGLALGTPLYMSPEQARNAASVGPPTDQWAFALITYRALTAGQFFGLNGSTAELLIKIVADPILSPRLTASSLPEAFDGWFLRSLQRDPSARFASIAEQATALAAALGDPPLVTPSVVLSGPPSSSETRQFSDSAETAAPTPSRKTIESAETLLQPSGTIAAASIGVTNEAPHGGTTTGRSKPPFVLLGLGALLVVGGVVAWQATHGPPSPVTSATSPPSLPSVPSATAEPKPSASVVVVPSPSSSEVPKPTASASGKPFVPAVGTKPKPTASVAPSVSAPPTVVAPPPKAKLPAGASCTRSNECESALCVAEVCK